MLESKIQAKVTKYLRDKNIPYIKTTGGGSRGWPDITACVNGKFLAIELKSPGNVPTQKQESKLNHIRNNYGVAVSYDNFNDVKLLIDMMSFGEFSMAGIPKSLHGKEVTNVDI